MKNPNKNSKESRKSLFFSKPNNYQKYGNINMKFESQKNGPVKYEILYNNAIEYGVIKKRNIMAK